MKVLFGAHPRVENPNNSDRCVEDAIIDDVLTNVMITKARSNVVPRRTKVWMCQKFAHGVQQAIGIAIPLL